MVGLIVEASEFTREELPQDCYRIKQSSAEKGRRNVVWIPLGGDPAEQGTALKYVRPSTVVQTDFLLEEALDVEARITGVGQNLGDGFKDAELIRRNLIAAFHKATALQGIRLKGEIGPHQWITQQEGAAAHANNNAETVVQRFRFRVPIPKSTHRTVALTGFSDTCEIDTNL